MNRKRLTLLAIIFTLTIPWCLTDIIHTPSAIAQQNITISSQVSVFTDRSGTITTGGTAQQVMTINAVRHYYIFQNISTGDFWYSFTNPTPTPGGLGCFKVTPGGTTTPDPQFVTSQAMYLYGATTGQAFSLSEG